MEPRWSSGEHGDNPAVADLVSTLVEGGADVVLNGHDHDYERFRRQAPDGSADPGHGVREFVVGTGGTLIGRIGTPIHANSLVRYDGGYGVLSLRLGQTSYSWKFVSQAGKTFADAGSGTCH